MTQQELIETLTKVRQMLTSVAEDCYWQNFSTDDTNDTDLITDLNDAIHYSGEVIRKLEGQQP